MPVPDFKLTCPDLAATRAAAASLAPLLQPGDVIGLIGSLGAGKTFFTQALVAALGSTDEVSSPTFGLLQEYEASAPVIHIDAYRLRDLDEFLELGVDELLGGEHICIIEWADRVAPALPRETLWIALECASSDSRELTITAQRGRGATLLQLWSAAWSDTPPSD